MDDHLPRLNPKSLLAEVSDCELGDERRDRRYGEVMMALASAPSEPFAAMCTSSAQQEALYRFMRNAEIDWHDLVEPHFEQTAARARNSRDTVLAVHDTTHVKVADDAELKSYLNTGKRGFLAHLSLVLELTGRPLGAGALQVHLRRQLGSHSKKKGRNLSGPETAKLKSKEYDRWYRGVDAVQERLEGANVVHVMDREADSFALLAHLVGHEASFVVRWCRSRKAALEGDEDNWQSIEELLSKAPTTKLIREVHVSKRRASTAPTAARRAPQREHRTARLRVARLTLRIRRPRWLTDEHGPAELQINVVRVYETNPPANTEPVEWVLLTNLPITSEAEVERVIDIYRRRWLIEDYFKAIKTGCAFRKRRLTNRQSILNAFAMFVPVAWKALLIRFMAQAQGAADSVLTETETRVLRAKAKQMRWKLPGSLTAKDVLKIIARLGGHRARSGPPGWKALMKGSDKFLSTVDGWLLREAEM
jgi:hypothetical protein